MQQRRQLFEGKTKIIFEGTEPETLILHFKDDVSSIHRKKKGVINNKGVITNKISEYLMLRLSDIGITNHFIKRINMREQLVHETEVIPVEVILRNASSGPILESNKA